MNYAEFKKNFQNAPLIFSKDVVLLKKNKQAIRNQLSRWQKKGFITTLKKGAYLLTETDRKIFPSRQFIANQLYAPSYISLESALNFYGLIPERVADVISITTKKTAAFKNNQGNFIYQHIKPVCFDGFRPEKDEAGLTYFIAAPEKALVDYFYLNAHKFKSPDQSIFSEEMRLQNTEDLETKKLLYFSALFKNAKLAVIAKLFCEFLKQGGR